MAVRFVNTEKPEPAILRRRIQEAKRAREYRLRKRAEENGTITWESNPEITAGAEPPTEPHHDLPANNKGQQGGEANHAAVDDAEDESFVFDDGFQEGLENIDSVIGEGETVEGLEDNESTEFLGEDERPDYFSDEQTDPTLSEDSSDIEYATEKLLQQFLAGAYGCGAANHQDALAAHLQAHDESHHCRLDQLFPPNIPHTLDRPSFYDCKTSNATSYGTATQFEELFCGRTPEKINSEPKLACLHTEHVQPVQPAFSFDVDSILGLIETPAVATHGIRFYSAPQYFQNVQTDVHLKTGYRDPHQERPRLIPSRLKDVPHFSFARIEGADFMTLFIFFLHLPYNSKFHRLTDEQLSRWFDFVFYPAVRQVCSADHLQHLPASYRHAVATCRAPKTEERLTETLNYRTQLRMSYFLPAQSLHRLWSYVLETVNKSEFKEFQDPVLLIEAKGTKLRFKSPTAPTDVLAVMETFEGELRRVLNFAHIKDNQLYVDIAKETYPRQTPRHQAQPSCSPQEPQSYLWRTCCLHRHLTELYDGEVPKSGQNFYYESMLRNAGGITTLTPAHSRLRAGGVLYGQMYNLVKEIIDAARTFPFQNGDLRHLALDNTIRDVVQGIRRKSVWSRTVTERAYLASKRRCHVGLTDSAQRAIGVREEYRITWTLFLSILRVLRSLPREHRSSTLRKPPSYLWTIRTSALVRFLWSNVNKFTTGFEVIRAESTQGITTWEQTKMMDMFLCCLPVSIGGHDYSRQGSLWWSKHETRTTSEVAHVRYGLGFSQSIEKYGYCWFEPLVDWSQRRFRPEITGTVLFGTSTLQKRYLQCGGHIRHFFDASRRAELALGWLQQHESNDTVVNHILSWLVHICLQQMRIDMLQTTQRDLTPEYRSSILDDKIQFCYQGLSTAFACSIVAVSAPRLVRKNPLKAANALLQRGNLHSSKRWREKPFHVLHHRILAAIDQLTANEKVRQIFIYRFHQEWFKYHWAWPHISSTGLAPRDRRGNRQWFSINKHGEDTVDRAVVNDWYWAEKRWRLGRPPALPEYLHWDPKQWDIWVEAHRSVESQSASYELRRDLEEFGRCSFSPPDAVRRNPIRSSYMVYLARTDERSSCEVTLVEGATGLEPNPVTISLVNDSLIPEDDEAPILLYQEQRIHSLRVRITRSCKLVFSGVAQRLLETGVQGNLDNSTLTTRIVQQTPVYIMPTYITPVRIVPHNYRPSAMPANGKELRRPRGRPRKYASKEEKAAVEATRKRIQRRYHAVERRTQQADLFYARNKPTRGGVVLGRYGND